MIRQMRKRLNSVLFWSIRALKPRWRFAYIIFDRAICEDSMTGLTQIIGERKCVRVKADKIKFGKFCNRKRLFKEKDRLGEALQKSLRNFKRIG